MLLGTQAVFSLYGRLSPQPGVLSSRRGAAFRRRPFSLVARGLIPGRVCPNRHSSAHRLLAKTELRHGHYRLTVRELLGRGARRSGCVLQDVSFSAAERIPPLDLCRVRLRGYALSLSLSPGTEVPGYVRWKPAEAGWIFASDAVPGVSAFRITSTCYVFRQGGRLQAAALFLVAQGSDPRAEGVPESPFIPVSPICEESNRAGGMKGWLHWDFRCVERYAWTVRCVFFTAE